jgi:hypothetical protein
MLILMLTFGGILTINCRAMRKKRKMRRKTKKTSNLPGAQSFWALTASDAFYVREVLKYWD